MIQFCKRAIFHDKLYVFLYHGFNYLKFILLKYSTSKIIFEYANINWDKVAYAELYKHFGYISKYNMWVWLTIVDFDIDKRKYDGSQFEKNIVYCFVV